MQTSDFQIQVNGIGQANALTIARFHQHLGLSQQDCVKRLLTAPAILQKGLTHERATDVAQALREAGLPCDVVDAKTQPEPADLGYELAVFITDFSNINQFAAEVAAFTGMSGEQVVRCLTATPAILLGQISATVADDLITRFSAKGIHLLKSNPQRARYQVVAYEIDAPEAVRQQYAQLGLSLQRDSAGTRRWESVDMDFDRAQAIWQQASQHHMPVAVQNADYLRFDVVLQSTSQTETARQQLAQTLQQDFGIPPNVHARLCQRLPVVLKRCVAPEQTEQLLQRLQQAGAGAVAESVAGLRFHLRFPQWQPEHAAFVGGACRTLLQRAVELPSDSRSDWPLEISANMHQALWLLQECKNQGIDCRVQRA